MRKFKFWTKLCSIKLGDFDNPKTSQFSPTGNTHQYFTGDSKCNFLMIKIYSVQPIRNMEVRYNPSFIPIIPNIHTNVHRC